MEYSRFIEDEDTRTAEEKTLQPIRFKLPTMKSDIIPDKICENAKLCSPSSMSCNYCKLNKTPTIMKCKDCKHWIEPKGKQLGAVWGECLRIQSNDFIELYVKQGNLSYGDGVVQTDIRPDFGCILWEKID